MCGHNFIHDIPHGYHSHMIAIMCKLGPSAIQTVSAIQGWVHAIYHGGKGVAELIWQVRRLPDQPTRVVSCKMYLLYSSSFYKVARLSRSLQIGVVV